jgi:hypothetical protein
VGAPLISVWMRIAVRTLLPIRLPHLAKNSITAATDWKLGCVPTHGPLAARGHGVGLEVRQAYGGPARVHYAGRVQASWGLGPEGLMVRLRSKRAGTPWCASAAVVLSLLSCGATADPPPTSEAKEQPVTQSGKSGLDTVTVQTRKQRKLVEHQISSFVSSITLPSCRRVAGALVGADLSSGGWFAAG